jgi:hypothetical protein
MRWAEAAPGWQAPPCGIAGHHAFDNTGGRTLGPIGQLILEVILGVQLRKSRRLRFAFYAILLVLVLLALAISR